MRHVTWHSLALPEPTPRPCLDVVAHSPHSVDPARPVAHGPRQPHAAWGLGGSRSAPRLAAMQQAPQQTSELVPTRFVWPYGGRQVRRRRAAVLPLLLCSGHPARGMSCSRLTLCATRSTCVAPSPTG